MGENYSCLKLCLSVQEYKLQPLNQLSQSLSCANIIPKEKSSCVLTGIPTS